MLQASAYSISDSNRSIYLSAEPSLVHSIKGVIRSIGHITESVKSSFGLSSLRSEAEKTSISNRNILEWNLVGKRPFLARDLPKTEQGIPLSVNPYALLAESANSDTSSARQREDLEESVQSASISSHLSLMSSLSSEASLTEEPEKLPYTSYWPRDLAKTYIHNMTPEQKQGWIERVRGWEFALGQTVQQQLLVQWL